MCLYSCCVKEPLGARTWTPVDTPVLVQQRLAVALGMLVCMPPVSSTATSQSCHEVVWVTLFTLVCACYATPKSWWHGLSNPRLTAWWNRYVCSQPWMQRHECVCSHPHNIPALHVQLGHVYSHICHGPSTEGLGTPHHSTIECWQGQTCLHTCFVPTGPHGGWACLSAWLPRPNYAMWPCGMNTHLHTHCVTW